MDFKVIKGVTHNLYDSEDEFRAYYSNYGKIKPWRSGKETDWVFTDDNCVVQILKRATLKSHTDRTETYIRTICGSFTISCKKLMLGDISENMYSFGKRKNNEHT